MTTRAGCLGMSWWGRHFIVEKGAITVTDRSHPCAAFYRMGGRDPTELLVNICHTWNSNAVNGDGQGRMSQVLYR